MTRRVLSLIVLGLLLAACDGSGGRAASTLGEASIRLTIHSVEETYARGGGDWYAAGSEKWYELAQTRADLTVAVRINGESSPDVRETETQLPDTAAGDYDQMRLIRDDDGVVYLQTRSRQTQEGQAFVFDTRDQVEFIHGDWEAYRSDKPATFRLSAEGLKTNEASLRAQFEDQFGVFLEALLAASVPNAGGRVEMDTAITFPSLPNTVYTFDGRAISYTENRSMEAVVQVVAREAPGG